MVVNRQKKSKKQRGGRTHGWGAGKKHRGKGNRGGAGKAGSGKRGQQRRRYELIGKKGMTKGLPKNTMNVISLRHIEANLINWIAKGVIKEAKGIYSIDAKALGADKVVGKSPVKVKLNVIAKAFSESAKEQILNAGGKVEITAKGAVEKRSSGSESK